MSPPECPCMGNNNIHNGMNNSCFSGAYPQGPAMECSTMSSYSTSISPMVRPGIVSALHDPELRPTYYIGAPCGSFKNM